MNNKYKSPRGIELVTQSLYLVEDDPDEKYKGVLTVERHNKWYYMYIIRPNGTVEEIHSVEGMKLEIDDLWADHVIYPRGFHEFAKELNLVYDDETFAHVCERFISDHLEDWGKLRYHLPEPNDVI